ncbi:MAG TPA: hypothetical protein PKD96_00570 [Candidatus Absconditabacterales bacterium]|nr:hypothetical protein [Candidatus Absconditabacterales bacterium]
MSEYTNMEESQSISLKPKKKYYVSKKEKLLEERKKNFKEKFTFWLISGIFLLTTLTIGTYCISILFGDTFIDWGTIKARKASLQGEEQSKIEELITMSGKKMESAPLNEGEDGKVIISAEETIDPSMSGLSETEKIVSHFYEAINEQDFEKVMETFAPGTRNTPTIQNYFSTPALQTFVKNLKSPIKLSNIHSEDTSKTNQKKVSYTITYELLNNESPFSEDRSITLRQKDNQRNIAEMTCLTKGCSRLPFFNPAKYEIK